MVHSANEDHLPHSAIWTSGMREVPLAFPHLGTSPGNNQCHSSAYEGFIPSSSAEWKRVIAGPGPISPTLNEAIQKAVNGFNGGVSTVLPLSLTSATM